MSFISISSFLIKGGLFGGCPFLFTFNRNLRGDGPCDRHGGLFRKHPIKVSIRRNAPFTLLGLVVALRQ